MNYGTELVGMLIALAVGLVIGFERGWRSQNLDEERHEEIDDQTVTGIRTFGLLGLAGGVVAQLAILSSPLFLAAALLGVAALLIVGYIHTSKATGDLGATTEVAALLAFLLGALAVYGFYLEAAVAAVITAVLLGTKEHIHALLRSLTRLELNASLQMLVIVLVVLPLLPNEAMGPWDSLNPQVIGWLVLLIAGISFVGYFAVRVLGDRVGLVLTALLGGLTSSTALTLAFSRMARLGSGRTTLLAAGIVLACGTMAPRLLLEVAVVNRALLLPLLPGIIGLGLVPLLAVCWLLWRHKGEQTECGQPALSNPMDLQQAIVMALVLTLVFMLSRGAEQWFGNEGVYVLALFAGIADVDAITIALAQQARDGLASEVAVRGILLAAMTNTAVKAGIVLVVGGWPLARRASLVLVLAMLAAGVGLFFG
ncbi:MgtC/SapB family protein [Thiopseudomonas denitrificans]|uniref:Uncharacterized membrane protein (DUF4010 family) n=1 Tax=Thiopseudomonas denitrificans TaxID=1501432 RepID=A0A4R6TU58_9GAMM|nr:DUF4010 domain-containing protein [Thiopseudomonas denitrificans]TDQ36656.1 uncharacterized membrane protein (DUF4010 family) [Thiopseudomonas denitrificans]